MFILSNERRGEPHAIAVAFQRYADYVSANRARFPPGAFALATSAWYFDPNDHRCPHDGWLEEVTVAEQRVDPEARPIVSIHTRLLGAYHDGYVEMAYADVSSYSLALGEGARGHCDWRYDELRLSASGRLLHEIEWWHMGETGRWLIEAADVIFSWIPRGSGS